MSETKETHFVEDFAAQLKKLAADAGMTAAELISEMDSEERKD